MAFNKKARYQIHERANSMSEISGRTDHLHAAHINHDRKSGFYNMPFNGVLMTIDEHLIDHYCRENINGLSLRGNYMAISALVKHVEDIYGLDYTDAIRWLVGQQDFRSHWQKRVHDLRVSWLCNLPTRFSLFKLEDYVSIA